MEQRKYEYRNLPIPGGGYVTGFRFHPKKDGVLYIRTDIGGAYRYEPETQRWKSLIDHVTMEDLSETYPIAVGLDDAHPERLYIASGVGGCKEGKLSVSDDYGEHFTYHTMPMMVHGNLNGRGTGYRLIVDRHDSDRLYYASQQEGLWTSPDRGATWEKLEAMKEQYLTCLIQTLDGSTLIVGTAGVTTKRGDALRGHSLYVSYDRGASFEPLYFEGQEQADVPVEGVRLAGLVAHRLAIDEYFLYVTYSVMGRGAYVLENGYSCDSGAVIRGRVVRYPIELELVGDGEIPEHEAVVEDTIWGSREAERIGLGEDITPLEFENADGIQGAARPVRSGLSPEEILEHGFGGIDVSVSEPGMLMTATLCKPGGDCIYRSYDSGETWECVLWDLEIGKMTYHAPYMRPCCNGGRNLIHWQTDVKINPFHANEAWFNTGTGVFRTENLDGEVVEFEDWCDGLEETVHLNLYSPPKGEVKLIDILGDLGGFAFTDLDTPCDNSFADADGNRYITCINADYSDEDPNLVVVTPRGNWTGMTKGGLILTRDQCRTFERLSMPWGLSEELDKAFEWIEHPNVNSGWVSLSADGQNIVWNVADGITLPVHLAVVSRDQGKSFARVEVYDLAGNRVEEGGFKVFADRSDSALFYGFGSHSEFYVSKDSGATFRQYALPEDFPEVEFALIDCANKTEVRGETGRQGVFYMALAGQGLWKLSYDRASDAVAVMRLGKEGDTFYRLGLGVGREGGDYYTEPKALYVSAILDGVYGFYRSTDDGKSFVRLNTDRQMFGDINSMEGDSRVFGRFYLATGSRGVLYGEEA